MKQLALIPFCVFAATAASVRAASIAINNASFENPVLAVGAWNDGAASGWTLTSPTTGDTFTERIAGFVSEGVNHQGLVLNVAVWQELPVSWAPNTAYSLVVGVGGRNTDFSPVGNRSSIYFESSTAAVGTSLASTAFDAGTLPAGTFTDTTLNFVTGAVAPAGNIRIRLSAEGAGRSHFDNLRLDATAVPEPSLAMLSGLGLVSLLRRKRA